MGRGLEENPRAERVIPTVFRPAAAADVEDAFRWYEQQRPGLGEEFLHEPSVALNAIAENPHRFPALHRQTRRALIRRFPYGVYYRFLDTRVVVVACLHGRRDPRRWHRRK